MGDVILAPEDFSRELEYDLRFLQTKVDEVKSSEASPSDESAKEREELSDGIRRALFSINLVLGTVPTKKTIKDAFGSVEKRTNELKQWTKIVMENHEEGIDSKIALAVLDRAQKLAPNEDGTPDKLKENWLEDHLWHVSDHSASANPFYPFCKEIPDILSSVRKNEATLRATAGPSGEDRLQAIIERLELVSENLELYVKCMVNPINRPSLFEAMFGPLTNDEGGTIKTSRMTPSKNMMRVAIRHEVKKIELEEERSLRDRSPDALRSHSKGLS